MKMNVVEFQFKQFIAASDDSTEFFYRINALRQSMSLIDAKKARSPISFQTECALSVLNIRERARMQIKLSHKVLPFRRRHLFDN